MLNNKHIVRVLSLLLMLCYTGGLCLKVWYLWRVDSIQRLLDTYHYYTIGLIGLVVTDFVNVFLVLTFVYIMTLQHNDHYGVRVYNYIVGIICFFAHLVFGIFLLTNQNAHIHHMNSLWDAQKVKDYASNPGVFHLMYYYERNGITPFLVINLAVIYANITIREPKAR